MPHRQDFGRIVTFIDQDTSDIEEGLIRHAKDASVAFQPRFEAVVPRRVGRVPLLRDDNQVHALSSCTESMPFAQHLTHHELGGSGLTGFNFWSLLGGGLLVYFLFSGWLVRCFFEMYDGLIGTCCG